MSKTVNLFVRLEAEGVTEKWKQQKKYKTFVSTHSFVCELKVNRRGVYSEHWQRKRHKCLENVACFISYFRGFTSSEHCSTRLMNDTTVPSRNTF